MGDGDQVFRVQAELVIEYAIARSIADRVHLPVEHVLHAATCAAEDSRGERARVDVLRDWDGEGRAGGLVDPSGAG